VSAELPAPLQTVCRVAGVSRSAAHEQRRRRCASAEPVPARRRPGPVGALPDAELLAEIRRDLRGTRSVDTACEDPVPKTPSLGRRSAPHGADFGFREPLPPHLAWPGVGRVAPRYSKTRWTTSGRVHDALADAALRCMR